MNKMEMNYEEILDVILRKMDENPQLDIDSLLEQDKEVLGLNEETMNKIKDTFGCLDKFDEKQKSLERAKKEGISRTEWLEDDIKEMAKSRGCSAEETDELIETLKNGVSNNIKEK